jgi:hypothetical protein
MDENLTGLLSELEQFGIENDELAAGRRDRLANITSRLNKDQRRPGVEDAVHALDVEWGFGLP